MASAAIASSLKLNPITGEEDLRDLTHPRHALSQFYRAFNTRDIAMMQDNWSDGEDISMDTPLGGIKRGWPEIRRVYEGIFSSHAQVRVEFHDYTMHAAGDLFFSVGRERGRYESSALAFDLHIRATRIFRFDGEHWRQVHHHGSIDDSVLLQRYQSAVALQSSLRSRALQPLRVKSPLFPML
ncbi:MAG: nuclear transport factor 2 family protein [Candidatus Acidiferrum sp.]